MSINEIIKLISTTDLIKKYRVSDARNFAFRLVKLFYPNLHEEYFNEEVTMWEQILIKMIKNKNSKIKKIK